jgi:phosphoglycolate phosphatase
VIKKLPAIKGLLFDKDGTLFDFEKTWNSWASRILCEVSEQSDVSIDELAAVIDFDLKTGKLLHQSIVIAGTHRQVTAALHSKLPNWNFDELESYLLDVVIETPQYEVVPLKRLFQNFKSQGFFIGVMTNDTEKGAQAHLEAVGILDLLDFLAGSDTGYGCKPSPEPLLAFAEATNLKPDEIAMVGDSLHDLQAADAAGMVKIAVLTGMATESQLKNYSDIVLPSIADLSNLLKKNSV